jgi:hypothetical protein
MIDMNADDIGDCTPSELTEGDEEEPLDPYDMNVIALQKYILLCTQYASGGLRGAFRASF